MLAGAAGEETVRGEILKGKKQVELQRGDREGHPGARGVLCVLACSVRDPGLGKHLWRC